MINLFWKVSIEYSGILKDVVYGIFCEGHLFILIGANARDYKFFKVISTVFMGLS